MNSDIQASDRPVQTKESPWARTIFVLGIIAVALGIFNVVNGIFGAAIIFAMIAALCQILAVIALVMSKSELKKGYPKTGLLYAGWILGIIGTVLLGLLILTIIVLVILLYLAIKSF